jgi:small multidrug resistance pump
VSATVALLIIYYVFGLAGSLCFKEGGTDASRRVFYFIVGNACGITSTGLLMGVYARMNVNLAMVLASSGTFLTVQAAFWFLYRSPLTCLQCLGILLVAVGTAMASLANKARSAAPGPTLAGPLAAREGGP